MTDDTRPPKNSPPTPDSPASRPARAQPRPKSPAPDAPRVADAEKEAGAEKGTRPEKGAGAERRTCRPGFGANARRGGKGDSGPGSSRHPGGAAAALIELDRDLMKLLVRRATLVSRIRGGKDHAASPAAIQAEKAVRIAWETGALSFSKDPRFSRQLFALLQDLKVLSKEQSDQAGSFTLTPAAKPVAGAVTGPTAARAAQMRIFLAACLGRPLLLENVMLSSALLDGVNACAQAGGKIAHEGRGPHPGRVTVAEGAPLSFAARTMFAGDDLFTLYLMAFLALGKTGTCRFTGGPRLKEADLSPLRHVVPLFGARLAHVVPHSQGVPVNLECSGQIPPLVTVPQELPFEGVCALLLAPLAWETPVTLNLAALPADVATAALAEVRPLHREAGAEVETHGPNLVFATSPLNPPEHPRLPLDPVLSAYLLALPAFVGGTLTLNGVWSPNMPESQETAQLLAWAGVSLKNDGDAITATAEGTPFSLPLQSDECSPHLGPLYLALLAKRCASTGETRLPHLPAPFPQEDTDTALAQDFFARLGLEYNDGTLCRASADDRSGDGAATAPPDWTSPDAYWSMGYALGAFVTPGIRLANPGSVTEVMPPFWKLYNSLPNPTDPVRGRQETAQETPGDKPARRRIIAE